MNRIEIEFEEQGIESLLGPVQPGQRVSAAGLLTLLDEGSEEQLLEAELPGYTDYQKKVKYRMIPFLW